MQKWQRALLKLGYSAETRFDELRGRLEQRLGIERDLFVQPYRWYGTPHELRVRGRVLTNTGQRPPSDNDTLWDNLLATYRRFNSREIPNASVSLRLGEVEQVVTTDEEGYFRATLPLASPMSDRIWHDVDATVLEPTTSLPTVASVLVPQPSAEFGIISDVDDTVLQTHATDLVRLARVTFLQNARMRLPFPGVSALYRALHDGRSGQARNPIFYVSSSPWNLYDLLTDFMALQGLPAGPLCLRDLGLDEEKLGTTSHATHKLSQVYGILKTYPRLPFILIGDSGQHDPEIYAKVVERFAQRIAAIVIRDVSAESREHEVEAIAAGLTQVGVPMGLVPDSLSGARLLADAGLLSSDVLPAIAQAQEPDPAAEDIADVIHDSPDKKNLP